MSSSSDRKAPADHAILDCLTARWSPYVFAPREIDGRALARLFEAARWAASSYNEQPWRFLVARRQDSAEFAKALDCLLEANQVWAQHASALVFTVVSRTFARNGNPNRVAEHDLGLAVGNLCAQATADGLVVHQMGGVNLSKVRSAYGVPDGFDPVTAIALGWPGDPDSADPALAERDRLPRTRRALDDTVFRASWDSPMDPFA